MRNQEAVRKILVVEDDGDVRRGLHIFLKAYDYETFLSSDGISAVRDARMHQPDLIILDLGLPAGDGFWVLRCLQENAHLSLIPVVVVSARDVRANKERALKAGARAFVEKPWDDDELLEIIRQLLGQF